MAEPSSRKKYVLKDKPAGVKTGLGEQSFGLNSGKKCEFMTVGRRGRQCRRATGML